MGRGEVVAVECRGGKESMGAFSRGQGLGAIGVVSCGKHTHIPNTHPHHALPHSSQVLEPSQSHVYRDMTLGEYLTQQRYSLYFIKYYVVPMCAAVWSVPNAQVSARRDAEWMQRVRAVCVCGHMCV